MPPVPTGRQPLQSGRTRKRAPLLLFPADIAFPTAFAVSLLFSQPLSAPAFSPMMYALPGRLAAGISLPVKTALAFFIV